MKFAQFFDAIFVINLDRRKDRWQQCIEEFKAARIPLGRVTRWSAYEKGVTPESSGSHTHRDIIRHIASGKIKNALILEDDFQPITTEMLKAAGHVKGRKVLDTHCSILNGEGAFVERFEAMIPFLPKYDFLYLGGGYAEKPIARFSRHVIQCGMVKGTHAYAITHDAAVRWTDWIDGKTNGDPDNNCGASDDIVSGASHDGFKFYMLQPRLLTQRPSYSDLTKTTTNYLDSMTNPDHEAMFPGGPE